MLEWKPTPELRLLQKAHRKGYLILQQKWIEVGPHAVADPPGPSGCAPSRVIEGQPTGKFEWREIPTVEDPA